VLQGCPLALSEKEGKKPQVIGHVFYLGENQEEEPNVVLLGTSLFNKTYSYVQFDSGAGHSFVTLEFTKKLSKDPSEMEHVLCVTTPMGFVLFANVIFRNCPLTVHIF